MGKPYTHLKFGTPGPYQLVRHPLYLGWLFSFWATPTMTGTHLLFAFVTTAYILVAIQFEERDLVDSLGEDYRKYRAARADDRSRPRPAARPDHVSGAPGSLTRIAELAGAGTTPAPAP